jgi:hypothetical protein
MERTTRPYPTSRPPFDPTTEDWIYYNDPCEIKIEYDGQPLPLTIEGTGLHLLGFNGMYLDDSPSTKWYLVIRYYGRLYECQEIVLIQSVFIFLHHHPNVQFIMENQFHPQAVRETTYYELVPVGPMRPYEYKLRRMLLGDPVDHAGIRFGSVAIFTTYPSRDTPIESLTQAMQGCEILDQHLENTSVDNRLPVYGLPSLLAEEGIEEKEEQLES